MGGWRNEDLEFKIEDGWLWIEDRHSRFEDLIVPHRHLLHVCLYVCSSFVATRYFEDIVKL